MPVVPALATVYAKDEGVAAWLRGAVELRVPDGLTELPQVTSDPRLRYGVLPVALLFSRSSKTCPVSSRLCHVHLSLTAMLVFRWAFQKSVMLVLYQRLPMATGCWRFDRNSDGKVDHLDFEHFENCATGSAIPLDPDNLPAGCAL